MYCSADVILHVEKQQKYQKEIEHPWYLVWPCFERCKKRSKQPSALEIVFAGLPEIQRSCDCSDFPDYVPKFIYTMLWSLACQDGWHKFDAKEQNLFQYMCKHFIERDRIIHPQRQREKQRPYRIMPHNRTTITRIAIWCCLWILCILCYIPHILYIHQQDIFQLWKRNVNYFHRLLLLIFSAVLKTFISAKNRFAIRFFSAAIGETGIVHALPFFRM